MLLVTDPVLEAVDPHMRHIQVVFFDNYLSSTTFSTSFLDIDKLIRIVTELRASSSFELFGLGCPGKEDAAASLAALAAWFFLHRRRVFPPPLAAHLLDPPLQGRRCPTPSPLIPSMSSVSADKGSAALVTTVSKPDSVTLLNPVSHEQEGTDSFDAAPPSRKRRRRRHLHQTEAHLTPVVSEEPADSGLAAGLAAQGAAVSETDSVVGKDVAVMKTERASFKPRDSAQSVNNKTGIAMGNKLRRSALPESGGGPEAIPGSFSNVRSSADCFSGAGHGAFVSEPVSSKTVNSEGAGVAAKWTEAVNSELLHCATMHPETVFVAADLLTDPVLEHGSATTGNQEAGILPRASPEAELEASVASGPLDVAEAAVILSSSQPFMLALSPSTQSAAQLVTQLSSVSASTSPARPSSSPPAATASPSSPPDQPSIAAPQPEEELSERGEPASPAVERSEPAELSERGNPPRRLWSAASRGSSASGGSPRRSRRRSSASGRSPPRRLWSSASRRSSPSGGSPHHLRGSSVSRSRNSASGRSGYRQERGPAGRRSAHRLSWSCRGRSCSRSRSRSSASKRSARHRERGSAGRSSAHSHRRSAGGRNPISLRRGSVCRVHVLRALHAVHVLRALHAVHVLRAVHAVHVLRALHAVHVLRAVHVQRALHAVHVQRAGRHGLFYSVARQSCNTTATGSVAARRSCSAATIGRLAGHQRCSTAATGSVAGPQNCFVAAAGPMAVRRRSSVSTDGLKKCTPWERRVLATVVIGSPSSLLPALLQLIT
ncbi:unnamed protein product [Oreochromis niloticus]|nr:unnamed protein product [Mustela putorius furo]